MVDNSNSQFSQRPVLGEMAIQIQFSPKLNWSFLAFVQKKSLDNGKSYLNDLSKEEIDILYSYDFHLHHQLVDECHMLGEFESFYYNRNVHNRTRYQKPNFLLALNLIWYVDSQIPGKGFLIVLKKVTREGRNSCFSTLSLRTSRTLC